jgi:hypothetical protein
MRLNYHERQRDEHDENSDYGGFVVKTETRLVDERQRLRDYEMAMEDFIEVLIELKSAAEKQPEEREDLALLPSWDESEATARIRGRLFDVLTRAVVDDGYREHIEFLISRLAALTGTDAWARAAEIVGMYGFENGWDAGYKRGLKAGQAAGMKTVFNLAKRASETIHGGVFMVCDGRKVLFVSKNDLERRGIDLYAMHYGKLHQGGVNDDGR